MTTIYLIVIWRFDILMTESVHQVLTREAVMSAVSILTSKAALTIVFIAFAVVSQTVLPSWQDISPKSGLNYTTGGDNFGIAGFGGAMPDQPKTLYIGTCMSQGIWKSTNGGESWFKVSTGINGNNIDGRNHALCVDPTNSDIVYTNCLFGNRQGVWKSTNGGVDWMQIQGTINNNDVAFIQIDPLNHLHIMVALHSGDLSVWESRDGGVTWKSLGCPGGAMTYPAFLGKDNAGNPNSDYWLFMTEGGGLWRTEDAGGHWTQVSTTFSRSHAGAGLYRAPNNTLYACVNSTIARSTDNGKTWADLQKIGNLPGTCDGYSGIISNGTTIWTMPENTGAAACGPYKWLTTPESGDGTKWTAYNSQLFADGPMVMAYDAINKIVYADCWRTGIWKLQLGTNPTGAAFAVSQRTMVSHMPAGEIFDIRGRLLAPKGSAGAFSSKTNQVIFSKGTGFHAGTY
jgi:hypothetical protein